MLLSNENVIYATVWARLAAYALDIVLLFIGIMVTQLLLKPVNPLFGRWKGGAAWRHHLWTGVTVSLPILIYFALCFSSVWQATIGMKILGIHVSAVGLTEVGSGRALLRSLVMLIPFEVNHIAMFYPTPIWSDPKPGFRWGFLLVSVLIAIYLGTIFLTQQHQSIHDLVANTIVLR